MWNGQQANQSSILQVVQDFSLSCNITVSRVGDAISSSGGRWRGTGLTFPRRASLLEGLKLEGVSKWFAQEVSPSSVSTIE